MTSLGTDPTPSFAKNIIVRMPNWIGDLVMATPVLTDLHEAFPDAKLTVMCREPLGELLQGHPAVDHILPFKKSTGLMAWMQAAQRLRAGRYDVGIILTHSFSSAWWFWQGKVGRKIGYAARGRTWLLDDALPAGSHLARQHLVESYKALLTSLHVIPSKTAPRLYLTDAERMQIQAAREMRGIPSGARLIGIHPGASYGSAKCWLPERFKEVAERLLAHESVHLLFFGDRSSQGLVQSICQGLGPRAWNFSGDTSLRALLGWIAGCDLLLTNDSGPMHMADAIGTDVVALFGSTNEQVTGPYQRGVVIHKHVSCSPCYKRECPIDFRCMKQIEVKEVYDTIVQRLRLYPSQ